jgi:2-polyprenyl-3-methyl-5-hydroxy-6-metoxy-1,4-benzoquinol methylase
LVPTLLRPSFYFNGNWILLISAREETHGGLKPSTRVFRADIFSKSWPLDEEIRDIAAGVPSHNFLANPSGQYAYIYLTQFVKAFSERQLGRPFGELTVLDWGCGKGHVSKLIRDLGPKRLDSCDILSEKRIRRLDKRSRSFKN